MRRVVIFLHGFTHTGASWEPVVSALGERYRALTPDIRGHGSRSQLRPVTLKAVLADISALTSQAFTLAGYSMGGRIALHVALALPDRVRRLVLIGASPGIADEAERAARRAADERLAGQIESASIEQFARSWAANPVLAGQPASLRRRLHADRLRNTPDGLAAAIRGLGAAALPPLWHRLGELRMPVDLVAGERDEKFAAIASQMGTRIERARIAIIAGAGHAVHLEAPGRVAGLIAGDSGVPLEQTVAEPGPRRDLDKPA